MVALVPPSCKVYTPDALAKAVIAALGDAAGLTWLEPCAGHGAFLAAISHHGISASRVTAIDLEKTVPAHPALAPVSTGLDFLEWAAATQQRFDRVVCNPPYVGIGRLAAPLRDRALNE